MLIRGIIFFFYPLKFISLCFFFFYKALLNFLWETVLVAKSTYEKNVHLVECSQILKRVVEHATILPWCVIQAQYNSLVIL